MRVNANEEPLSPLRHSAVQRLGDAQQTQRYLISLRVLQIISGAQQSDQPQ